MAEKKKRRFFSALLKTGVSALLLFFIIKKAGPLKVMGQMHAMNPWLFLLSVVLYVAVAWLVALRWRILLDYRYTVRKLFSLHMIGNFFNTILPGTMGGDAVKAYYLYRETQSAGESFGSVFLDRYLGLSARLSLGLVSGIAAFSSLKEIGMHLVIPALFALFLAGSVAAFRFRFGKRFVAVADFYNFLLSRLKNRRIMIKTFLLSLVAQILLILMISVIARGIGQKLSFTELFVFVPIIMTIMIIPVSISGFGVREGAFIMLFGLTGVPASTSVSISFLWYLSTVAASLIGLVEYLRYRKQAAGSEQSEGS